MINKFKHAAKEGTRKFIKLITVMGTTLFITLNVNANPASAEVKKEINDVFKKNPDKEIIVKVEGQSQKAAKFETLPIDTNNAIDYAIKNVDKYYPDMKIHLQGMIDQFGKNTERRSAVDSIFNQTIGKISDPKQRIGGTIYGLGVYIFREDEFSKAHDSDITDATFKIMETAGDEYNIRLNKRKEDAARLNQELKNIQAEIEKNKAEIEKNKAKIAEQDQQLRNILTRITIQDINTNAEIKKLVIDTKALFVKYGVKTTPHIDQLFKLVP